MTKLTLVTLLAILVLVRACPNTLSIADLGDPVSYDGTVKSFILISSPQSDDAEQQHRLGQSVSELVPGCVRIKLVRTENLVEVAVRSCNGSSFSEYERELTEALGLLQTAQLWISPKTDGVVTFAVCWSRGSISLYVAVEKQCLPRRGEPACREIASGRKTLKGHFNQMKSFDARDMLPKGDGSSGSGFGGRAGLIALGLIGVLLVGIL